MKKTIPQVFAAAISAAMLLGLTAFAASPTIASPTTGSPTTGSPTTATSSPTTSTYQAMPLKNYQGYLLMDGGPGEIPLLLVGWETDEWKKFFTDEELKKIEAGQEFLLFIEGYWGPEKESDKKLVEAALKGRKLGFIANISAYKVLGTKDYKAKDLKKERVTSLNGRSVTINMVMPKDIAKEGRKYSMIRVHNDVAEDIQLFVTDFESFGGGKLMSLTTDRFSTYAGAYEEAGSAGLSRISPNTGDNTSVNMWALCTLVGFIIAASAFYKKNAR